MSMPSNFRAFNKDMGRELHVAEYRNSHYHRLNWKFAVAVALEMKES